MRLVIVLVAAVVAIYLLTRPRPECPGRWYEPEDGYGPGDMPPPP
jgi:hypothetical protein